MTDCGYASPVTSRGRLPAPDPARADDRARAGRDVGLRAARGPRARDAGVDRAGRAGGARPARRSGHAASSRRTACRRSARCCRSRASATLQHQLPGPVDGGGDPRDPPRRLPADRRATRRRARALGPEPARPRRVARVAGEASVRPRQVIDPLSSVSLGYVACFPETRYARLGDLHLAYQVLGEGPPDILLLDQWFGHIEAQWDVPPLAALRERLASFGRLIMFDKRGTGLSDPIPTSSCPRSRSSWRTSRSSSTRWAPSGLR